MAVILPGPLISDIRGKVGDVVFERNAGGLYVRAKGTVTQVPSDPRTAVLLALEYLSKRYQANLSAAHRAHWTNWAASYPDTDRWGRSKVRTGQQAYISVNFHAAVATGVEYYDWPPAAAPNPISVMPVHIHLALQEIHLSMPIPNWPTPGADQCWFIYQGAQVNVTRNYFSGPFRFAGLVALGLAGWQDPTVCPTVFNVTAGHTSWIRFLYNDFDPIRCSRRITIKATTV